jgi:D-sedoheptulose 7-phosphate isomerase
MRDAILRKADESARQIRDFCVAEAPAIEACANAMARRLDAGGRLFSFGNGGSACDAAHVAVEFQHPLIEKRRAFAALALGADVAGMSAIGNDDDFARVFADPLKLHGSGRDVALGFSTSGKSPNVLRAFQAAKELGCLTVALTGRDGGKLPSVVDHAFVVPSYSTHRIQEVHVVLLHMLWDLVHIALGADDVI